MAAATISARRRFRGGRLCFWWISQIGAIIAVITASLWGIGMLTKQAIYHEVTSFLAIFVYLVLLLGLLVLHEAVVSAKNGIEYHFYGLAIINALILGKIILIADDLHFAEWFIERAPIYSILVKSLAFTILLLIFDIVEEEVVDMIKGKTFGDSFPHVGDGSPRAYFYMVIIFFIGLIPFFSYKEIGRVFGERELRSLFFTPAKGS